MHTEAIELSVEELENETMTELPGRELLIGLTLFGIPLVGVSGVGVDVDTSGPGWLFSA